MRKLNALDWIALVLLIIGGLNWLANRLRAQVITQSEAEAQIKTVCVEK